MTPISSADVIANRLNIHLARSQQLASSWLPPDNETRTAAERDKEEALIFNAEPELLGLGYKSSTLPEDVEISDSRKRENELRKRLLGKRPRQASGAIANGGHGSSKPRPQKAARREGRQDESDDDDSRGRTTLGKAGAVARKVDHDITRIKNGTSQAKESRQSVVGQDSDTKPSRPKSFLDQVLTEKATKSKKRRNRKKQIVQESNVAG